jgi:hypothetical protein
LYKTEVYPDAQDQIAALSPAAQVKLSEAIAVLQLVPWNGVSVNKKNPDGALRQLMFGPVGAGMVTYLVLEDQREVHIVKVLWLGD